ncbi:DM13 domain-containing protein, partial [Pseudoalteromonas ruthenica]
VSISTDTITFQGTIAPGPDYKLYLSKQFVETEADFMRLKPEMISIADITTFDSFIVTVPKHVDIGAFNTVIIWCESFSQF